MDKSINNSDWTLWSCCGSDERDIKADIGAALTISSMHDIRIRQIQVDEYELQDKAGPGSHWKIVDSWFCIAEDPIEASRTLSEQIAGIIRFNSETLTNMFIWANAIWNG